MATKLCARMCVTDINQVRDREDNLCAEQLHFHPVALPAYPEDGSDPANTFAKFAPSAYLVIDVRNPELFGKHVVGEVYDVTFTPVAKKES